MGEMAQWSKMVAMNCQHEFSFNASINYGISEFTGEIENLNTFNAFKFI